MIKKNLPKLIITSIVTLIPIIIGLIIWDMLPRQIPVHWNTQGEVDNFGSKSTAVFVIPAFLTVLHWLCVIVTTLDPKNKNIKGKPLTLVFWICPMISLVCSSLMYAIALGYKINIEIIAPLLMGVLFVIIGNYLPKCQQNYTLGIKLPWTLNDEENWNKTHRFTGVLWVICGVAIIATSLLGSFVIFFSIVILMVIIPVIYSYSLHKKGRE